MGIAETDPTLDIKGLDTRNKILVITNQVMGESYGVDDVAVTGISGVSADDIERAAAEGKIIKLIGRGIKEAGKVSMTVEPTALDPDHPLAGIHYSEKGISYLTDTMGRVTVSGGKSSPQGAAAALLKDLIHVSLLAASA
jgi:homoserine dehydrogenase